MLGAGHVGSSEYFLGYIEFLKWAFTRDWWLGRAFYFKDDYSANSMIPGARYPQREVDSSIDQSIASRSVYNSTLAIPGNSTPTDQIQIQSPTKSLYTIERE
jgi:hypothetical protein